MTLTVELSTASADVHTRRILAELSRSVYKSKRIVVVTGAGISCSCGIPVSQLYIPTEGLLIIFLFCFRISGLPMVSMR